MDDVSTRAVGWRIWLKKPANGRAIQTTGQTTLDNVERVTNDRSVTAGIGKPTVGASATAAESHHPMENSIQQIGI